jgi:hypothetical protein
VTPRKRYPKLCNEDDRSTIVSAFVDPGDHDPYAVGILDVTIQGQRMVIDGPDGAEFDGTLHEFCEIVRAIPVLRAAHAEFDDAERERLVAREMHAEAMQTVENLRWLFGPPATVTTLQVKLEMKR